MSRYPKRPISPRLPGSSEQSSGAGVRWSSSRTSQSPDVRSALKVLCRRHEVIAIRVTDPREQELPDVGTVTLEDPETGEQVTVDTSDTAFRTQYAALAAEAGRALAAGFSRAGIGNVSLLTTDSYDIPLNQFFRGMKRQRRRNGRLL